MSHHVVVRDDQEPALIFANGLECRHELVGQLLEWCPKVIALDGAFDRLVAYGIKVDAVVGDMDSLNHGSFGPTMDEESRDAERTSRAVEYLYRKQDGVEWVYTPDQEATDLQKALRWLYEKGHRAAHILWANGPGVDHFLGNLHALATGPEDFAVSMIQDDTRLLRLPRNFSKCYESGVILSLLPFPLAQSVYTENLVYPLSGEDLAMGQRIGIRNQVANQGLVRITYSKGCLMLQEPLCLSRQS